MNSLYSHESMFPSPSPSKIEANLNNNWRPHCQVEDHPRGRHPAGGSHGHSDAGVADMAEQCVRTGKDWKQGLQGISGASVGNSRPRSATGDGELVTPPGSRHSQHLSPPTEVGPTTACSQPQWLAMGSGSVGWGCTGSGESDWTSTSPAQMVRSGQVYEEKSVEKAKSRRE